jgi:hypothetical protein
MVPDAPQTNVWSGLAEVSPAPPVTPDTVVDVAVGVVAVVEPVAVGAAVAGVATEVEVLPHPAAARAAIPSAHDAMRRRVRPTKNPPSLEIISPFGLHQAAVSHRPRSRKRQG